MAQRLIDANELKKGIMNHCAFGKEWDRTLAICEIDSATTVDAVPVVHGHWIPIMLDDPVFEGVNIENIKSLNGKMNRCSVCGADIITNGIDDTGKGIVATVTNPYCRWCGAKMDGKGGEQDGESGKG